MEEEEEVNAKTSSSHDSLVTSHEDDDNENPCQSNEEIMKELKNVKRQNWMTHCLLTAMIVVTVAWQLSEVSLILRIKDGLSNPLKSVGGIFKGLLKNRPGMNVQDMMKQATERQKHVIEPTSLPGLRIPEFPHLELPGFDTSDEEED
ncbi:hypothetical protein DH2020_049710 [Rehmannia glutinosa]|uniref:Transmembrane protein n=1 Tax=Rehmannia glutinosa TaxID=99300 RepID=A0ABR0U294_REHGL